MVRPETPRLILRRTYLKMNNIVCDRVERITGSRPEDYKKMDTRNLIRIFNGFERKEMDGFEFMAYVLSTLIVEQPLPNANHRTALSFVAVWLDTAGFSFKFELEKHDRRMTQYILDSKVIIENRGTDKRYRANHLDITRVFLSDFLGKAQSGRLGSISSILLITSFSDSSKDFGFFSDGPVMDNE